MEKNRKTGSVNISFCIWQKKESHIIKLSLLGELVYYYIAYQT